MRTLATVMALQRFGAPVADYLAVAEVVRDIESEVGSGAPVEKTARRVGPSELVAVTPLIDLVAVVRVV